MPVDLDNLPATVTGAASVNDSAEQLRSQLYPDDDPQDGPAEAAQPALDPPAPAAAAPVQPAPEPEPDPYADKVVLFKVSGRDYLTDAEPDTRILLRFLWTTRTGDELGALDGLLMSLLGAEQFEALMNGPAVLRKPQFQAIIGAAIQHLAGEDEAAPKGRTAAARTARGGRG